MRSIGPSPTAKMTAQIPKIPGPSPSSNPLDIFRLAIARELAHSTGKDVAVLFPALNRSTTPDKGDIILPVPRLGKGFSAESLAAQFRTAECPQVNPPIADGTSLQFHLNPASLPGIVLPFVLSQQQNYGLDSTIGLKQPTENPPAQGNDSTDRKTIIVEFSSPNIAKEFHVGHLRSTIIGPFISNLYEGAGYRVIRLNYLGDWGRQFGLLVCGWHRYGDAAAFAKDPIRHLFEVYVKISEDMRPEEEAYKAAKKAGEDTATLEKQGILGEAKGYFKRMEEGDREVLELWERFRSLSIERYAVTYARLNIEFTEYSGESKVKRETMDRALEVLRGGGIVEDDEGAVLLDFGKHGAGKLGKAILRNRAGTSNYLLRDVGAAVQREEEYGFDEMLYVVMSEQEGHLKWLFKTMELMGGGYAETAKKMKHISYGRVNKMSTRKGTAVFLDGIIDQVTESMHDVMRSNEAKYREVDNPERTAEQLAISAIMVQDMLGKRANNYDFDLKRMTSFEGDTGPYLQYAHARLCSIFRKVGYTRDEIVSADFSLLVDSPQAIDLIRVIARYPDMVKQTLKTLEPTTILTYLFALAHQLSASYEHVRVVNPPEGREMSLARAGLYEAARQTLRNGMVLLGMTPVERM